MVKVSFYNQDEVTKKAIKSSPVISVLGLVEKPEHITKMGFKQDEEAIFAVGETKARIGWFRVLPPSRWNGGTVHLH